MKLLISEMQALGRYLSREFHYTMTEMIRTHGWRQIETRELWSQRGSLKSRLLATFGELPSVILFWEGFDFFRSVLADLRDLPCTKCIFTDDLHYDSELRRSTNLLAYVSCDVILPAYEPVFDAFYPGLRSTKKIVWTPHAASPDYCLPFNRTPRRAVLLSGRIHKAYPLRQTLHRLQQSGDRRIDLLEHPGSYDCTYDYERDRAVGPGFAESIQSRLCGFTCSSMYRYTVAKFFEIPATGSLLLADATVGPELSRLGFIPYTHYVPVHPDRLEAGLDYVLNPAHRETIDAIRRQGQELVLSRHTTRDRARLIDEACAPG